ncbi:RING-type domain-containing protein [Mycena sanguinolenta]|uniref:RING-type domain-containing protein n=1 Tax=Mycena sanguinolenta TaxID=230812 RepID=A0A8H6XZR1_9AGAR|nr:RING-type domain-containing protein [Mycena sanguinolenta]
MLTTFAALGDMDIPPYPPPSFQEAISSPPVSVCPSTTTLTTTLGRFTSAPTSRNGDNSDSDSEFDADSLDMVDSGSPVEQSSVHSQMPPRGRGILDSEPDSPTGASSSSARSHRRHLSLSPLRTLFSSRNPRDSAHTLSAHSTPSHPLAFSRSSPFSRSTASLRNLISSAPLVPPSPSSAPPLRSESFLGSRRPFSHKGKERAKNESLDSWEIVESELPAAPTTSTAPEAVSPVIDVSSANLPPPSPASITPEPPTPIHPLSERDRRAKNKIQISQARVREPPVASPPTVPLALARLPPPPTFPPPVPPAPGEGPPIVTVRVKKSPPPPPPKKKPRPISSPLRGTLLDLDLDRAIRTPLPLTPVTGSPTSSFALSMESRSAVQERPDLIIPPPTPRSPSRTSENTDVSAVDAQGQHHYPGRPLPPRPRAHVDSTYAAHPDFPQVGVRHEPPIVPEGLLIDLDGAETPTMRTPHTQPFSSVADQDLVTPTATNSQRNSSASSVYLAPPAQFQDVTDLDVLLARLENDQGDGSNYDDLWMVSDFIGPATPTSSDRATSRQSSSPLLTGAIEVQRKRITKDGRVKLKLTLLGIAVDRCGICMAQFKKVESARLSERCKHVFHDRCLAQWVVRSRTCPLCRIALDLEAGN